MRFCQAHFELKPAPGLSAIKCAFAMTDQRVRARLQAEIGLGPHRLNNLYDCRKPCARRLAFFPAQGGNIQVFRANPEDDVLPDKLTRRGSVMRERSFSGEFLPRFPLRAGRFAAGQAEDDKPTENAQEKQSPLEPRLFLRHRAEDQELR